MLETLAAKQLSEGAKIIRRRRAVQSPKLGKRAPVLSCHWLELTAALSACLPPVSSRGDCPKHGPPSLREQIARSRSVVRYFVVAYIGLVFLSSACSCTVHRHPHRRLQYRNHRSPCPPPRCLSRTPSSSSLRPMPTRRLSKKCALHLFRPSRAAAPSCSALANGTDLRPLHVPPDRLPPSHHAGALRALRQGWQGQLARRPAGVSPLLPVLLPSRSNPPRTASPTASSSSSRPSPTATTTPTPTRRTRHLWRRSMGS